MGYKHARNAVVAGLVTSVAGLGPAPAHAVGPQGTPAATSAGSREIVARFYDGHGMGVILRRGYLSSGGGGFGWEKITRKHNLTSLSVLKGIIANPDGGKTDPTFPTRVVYHALALQEECVIGIGCRPRKAVPMVAVVEFGPASWDKDQVLGVVTAYCKTRGTDECPPWVNRIKRIEY